LSRAGWKLDRTPRAVLLGSLVGLLGAGGQLLLFLALRSGPAYIVFPIISLYPVITVLLSVTLLGERAGRRAWTGIIIAIAAIAFLSYLPASGGPVSGAGWLVLAVVVFCCWGVQAYVMKFANRSMSAESIFFYMMVTGVALVPAALLMTDFSLPVEWGWRGSGVALLVQSLNAIGALTLVYAVRYGKAIIVVPMTSLAPVLTIVLSLMLYAVIPGPVLVAGMVLAVIAIVLLAE
jgi:drug/metabolite transporter (DMT)-like permease